MKNTFKKFIRLFRLALATTAVASLTSYITAKYLVRVALDRKQPKAPKGSERLITGSKSSEAFCSERDEKGELLADRENETVELLCHDETVLTGHWIPCDNPKRIIIAMHGWRSAWYRDFGIVSDFWEANDCNVLYAEQRAQNNSGGEYMGFGLIERYDCLDWINYVIKTYGSELPIYLCGVSMGATTVLMASGLELPDSVHGIIADCGFTSPHAIWKHVSNENLHLPYGMYASIANTLCKKKIQFGAEDYSTVDALQNTSVPVLLIHGTDDHFVPVEMTYENYKACVSPKKLFVVPGADHCMSCYVDKEGYETVVREFWKQFDENV